jgi:hypothetical protein
MARDAREKISRRSWLLAGMAIGVSRAGALPALNVSSDGDSLHVAAPQLHFLTGRPLARLMDGNTVVFLSRLTLFREDHATVIRHQPEQITVSYDVWEERFQVALAVDRHSAKNLSLLQTEEWCMQNLAISALGLEPLRPFWLRFELRTASSRDISSVTGASGISISGLIDFFSRKAGVGEDHWGPLDAGPLRLIDLPRTVLRRARNG